MVASGTATGTAQIGVTGLAVMGRNLARNFARNGFTVAVHNRSYAKTQSLVADHGEEGTFVPSESVEDFVASLARPRKVVIMVKAGGPTDAVINELVPFLEEGDIVVDAGNAHFPDTIRREAALREKGLHFVGSGVSGGEEGALLGPSIMPGGTRESYESLGPILEKISAKVDGVPCCTYVGPDGAGHFVKMVHNGIEYADMQLIAEAYDLLRQGLGASAAEIGQIFADWNTGDLESFLIEITADVLQHVDAETGSAFVDIVLDQAEQKGTGRWTVQNGLDLGVPITGIAEATFARALSGSVPQRAAAVGVLPAHTTAWDVTDRDAFIEDVRLALYASKVVAYSQGFDQIAAASAEFGWDIDRGAMARIWRGGCIIRARFLNRITEAYERDANLPLLLADEYFTGAVGNGVEAWRRIVAGAALHGVPTPAFSSSLAYYDGVRAERLPAALIQAQRDFFGAHTYRRTDKDGTFHTTWSGDRTEQNA
ncbi:NADP-dependent phosphogluconate dehydrogenase [Cellulomonas fengjieae]|uniref:6-phosphogluconate dehydrogenase, decarboxylating n=1 Tax=Cellulomonas fengjieae TaxID=2819978 RepID=A0ABS3SGY3_9CELL|nr:NADP-dependent phosphogluconate dehydrogenase [Cellulomonas fengjieae]MBO3084230.1 NADP-dependent phosphogluconate dehydrogenase [Cellulomonas fengjieae]MBO3103550.1 NADP-dependent phosphogluconate dehydrogenase [Cellulomonas fengjieae]QVI64529.1 NADP-dependent phosphogluconate dehydrogenase [Cellulomonas fengjieae]